MKLVKCHIDNFGRLSDFDYDFSDGLNTILKDNGWGKTTFAAFLKAMIYGLAIDSSDRKKYLDSNKKCGGNLIFSYRDKKYQISRSFDVSSSEDKTDISCIDDSSDTRFNKDNIANTIFSLDEAAFDKVIFKKQNSTLIKDSIDLIKKNLNYMNEKANDAIEYNKIISSLQEQIKEYENEEKTGILNRINKEYTDKRQALDNMQSEIEKIDLVRKDIETIRKNIEELESKSNVEEEKKSNNPEYDALVKEFQEVTTKYNDLSSRFDKLVDMYNGSIIDYPTLMEIQKLSEKLETTKLLNGESEIIDKELLKELEKLDRLVKEDPKFIDKLVDILFSKNEIKECIAKIINSEKKVAKKELSLEDKSSMNNGNNNPSNLIETRQVVSNEDINVNLNDTLDLQKAIEELKNCYTSNGIRKADLIQKSKVYENEFEELIKKKKELTKYAKANVEPIIEALTDLKNNAGDLDLSDVNISNGNSTENVEEEISPDKLNYATCKHIMDILENADKKQNDLTISRQKLERENKELEELQAYIAQLENKKTKGLKPMDMPKEPNTSLGYVMGTLILIASIVTAIFINNPFMAAIGVIGIVIAIITYSNSKKYVSNDKIYKEHEDEYSKEKSHKENIKDVKAQYERVITSVNILKKLIETFEREIKNNESFIRTWSDKYNDGNEVIKQDLMATMEKLRNENSSNDNDESVFSNSYSGFDEPLPKKKVVSLIDDDNGNFDDNSNLNADLNRQNQDNENEARKRLEAINEKKKQICADYVEVHDMSLDDAINFLNEKMNESAKVDEELHSIRRNVDSITDEVDKVAELIVKEADEIEKMQEKLVLSENEANADKLPVVRPETRPASSSNVEELDEEVIDTDVSNNYKELNEKFDTINQVINNLGLNITMDNFKEVFDKIRQTVNTYEKYNEILNDKESQENQYQEEIQNIEEKLNVLLEPYKDCYADKSLKEKVDLMKNDMDAAVKYSNEIKDMEEERVDVQRRLNKMTAEMVNNGDIPDNMENLEDNKENIKKQVEELQTNLTKQIQEEKRLDELLERYPQNVADLKNIEHIQKTTYDKVNIIKKTINCLEKTKESATNSKEDINSEKLVETLNKYFNHFVEDTNLKIQSDDNLNVLIDNNGMIKEANMYGSGYNDICDFCMRLTLIDGIYGEEKPFIILDEPFINLDSNKLEKAFTLLEAITPKIQVIYFTSNKSRACKDIKTVFTKVDAHLV